jgi:hypothetical protein
MHECKQQKLGWIGGWLGGFFWVLILSVILAIRGETLPAVIGLLIGATAFAAVAFFAPWRHPRTTYRRLLAPIYVLFLCAVGWGIWSFGGPRQIGLNSWWSLLLLLPIMMPMWIVGNRRWENDDAQPPGAAGGASRPR